MRRFSRCCCSSSARRVCRQRPSRPRSRWCSLRERVSSQPGQHPALSRSRLCPQSRRKLLRLLRRSRAWQPTLRPPRKHRPRPRRNSSPRRCPRLQRRPPLLRRLRGARLPPLHLHFFRPHRHRLRPYRRGRRFSSGRFAHPSGCRLAQCHALPRQHRALRKCRPPATSRPAPRQPCLGRPWRCRPQRPAPRRRPRSAAGGAMP